MIPPCLVLTQNTLTDKFSDFGLITRQMIEPGSANMVDSCISNVGDASRPTVYCHYGEGRSHSSKLRIGSSYPLQFFRYGAEDAAEQVKAARIPPSNIHRYLRCLTTAWRTPDSISNARDYRTVIPLCRQQDTILVGLTRTNMTKRGMLHGRQGTLARKIG